MRWLPAGFGGLIEWWAPLYPDVNPTVEIRDASQVVVAAGAAASRDANPNTTISAGAVAGSDVLSVASATGLAINQRLLLSGQNAQREMAKVRSFSGTTVRLMTPLVHDHPSGAALQSTRISYTLTGAAAANAGDHWLMTVSWAVGAVAQPPHALEFAVSRYGMTNPLTEHSLMRLDPQLLLRAPAGFDWTDLYERAFQEAAERVTARGVPLYDYRGGAEKLERLGSYVALLLCAEQWGEAYRGQREEIRARVDEVLAVFVAVAAADVDRSQTVTEPETQGRTGDRGVGRRR